MGVFAAPSPRTAVLACGALTMGVFGTLFSNGYRFTGFHGDFAAAAAACYQTAALFGVAAGLSVAAAAARRALPPGGSTLPQ